MSGVEDEEDEKGLTGVVGDVDHGGRALRGVLAAWRADAVDGEGSWQEAEEVAGTVLCYVHELLSV